MVKKSTNNWVFCIENCTYVLQFGYRGKTIIFYSVLAPPKHPYIGVLKMIDIHSHIIPFVDDGPPNWDAAIEMAKQAHADGIRGIVATPHHKTGRYINLLRKWYSG